MTLIVMKFGGTSVADPERIGLAADKVVAEIARGNTVVVVVSAMSGATNQLLSYANMVAPGVASADTDSVVAAGEQITSGLMAMALSKRGIPSRSFQGWQIPLRSDSAYGRARILDIPPKNLKAALDAGVTPVVAGFQGVDRDMCITTLGRGGSDTSAVALAAALRADRCDIYTDVDGVYSTDPRVVKTARKLAHIAYEEMLELASLGAKVLMNRSVGLAMKWRVPVQVLSSFDSKAIGTDLPGTLVTETRVTMEQDMISGIAFGRDEAKITLLHVPDRPGVAAAIFGPLASAQINVDMIVQNISVDGTSTDVTFTVSRGDADRAGEILRAAPELKGTDVRIDKTIVKVSVVGIGVGSQPGIAHMMFKTLSENGINIQTISTSEIKISVLIAEDYLDAAVAALHTAYHLDRTDI